MKPPIFLAAFFLVACNESGDSGGSSKVDPQSFVGVWDSTHSNFCEGGVCGLVNAPQSCVGVELPPTGIFQIESITRGGWSWNMENIAITGNTVFFETTGKSFDIIVQKPHDTAIVTFAKGCQKQFKFSGGA